MLSLALVLSCTLGQTGVHGPGLQWRRQDLETGGAPN